MNFQWINRYKQKRDPIWPGDNKTGSKRQSTRTDLNISASIATWCIGEQAAMAIKSSNEIITIMSWEFIQAIEINSQKYFKDSFIEVMESPIFSFYTDNQTDSVANWTIDRPLKTLHNCTLYIIYIQYFLPQWLWRSVLSEQMVRTLESFNIHLIIRHIDWGSCQ